MLLLVCLLLLVPAFGGNLLHVQLYHSLSHAGTGSALLLLGCVKPVLCLGFSLCLVKIGVWVGLAWALYQQTYSMPVWRHGDADCVRSAASIFCWLFQGGSTFAY
jgi:hypothetical protein